MLALIFQIVYTETTEHPPEPRITVNQITDKENTTDGTESLTTEAHERPVNRTCEEVHGSSSAYCEQLKCEIVYGAGNPICDTAINYTTVTNIPNEITVPENYASMRATTVNEETVTIAVREPEMSRCEALFGVRSVLCARVPCMFNC